MKHFYNFFAALALTAMLPLSSSAFADGAAASYVDPYTGKLAARTIVNHHYDPSPDAHGNVGTAVAAWIRCFATIRVAERDAPPELAQVFNDTNCQNMKTLEGEDLFINQCISLIDDSGVGWIATGDTQALADAKAAGYCAGKTDCNTIPLFDKNGPEGNISDDTCDGTAAAMDGDVNVTVTSPTDDGDDDSQAMELAALFVAARDAIANLGIPPENRAALESRIDALEQSLKNAEATVAELSMSLEEIFQEIQNIPPVTENPPPPTVTVTVTTNECDGIVLIDDGNGGCELHPLVCPAPHRVEGLRCVADTEEVNIVMITATVTVTVTVSSLTEGENVVDYGGELVTVTTVAGTDEAIGMLASGVYLMVVEREPGNTIPTTSVSSGGGSGSNAGLMIGGVAVVGLALWYFTSDSDDLTWTPTYSYRNNNGNVQYFVGNRWQAAADNWRFYWQTAHGNRQESFYSSGIAYHNGIIFAALDGEGDSEMANLDFSLSATQQAGLWQLSGGYGAGLQISATTEEMQNRMNAAARYAADKYLLSATANTDGKTTTTKILYSYRF